MRQNEKLAGELNLNKREEIVQVAAKLFRRLGYIETSMKDISSEVGLVKASLYHHFSSKEELLNEVVNKGIDRILTNAKQVLEQNDLSPRDKLKKLIQYHLLHLTKSNDFLMVASSQVEKLTKENRENYIAKRDYYEGIFRKTIEEGIQTGDFPVVNVKLTVFAIFGMCNWVILWYHDDGPYSAQEITDYFTSLICDRILAK